MYVDNLWNWVAEKKFTQCILPMTFARIDQLQSVRAGHHVPIQNLLKPFNVRTVRPHSTCTLHPLTNMSQKYRSHLVWEGSCGELLYTCTCSRMCMRMGLDRVDLSLNDMLRLDKWPHLLRKQSVQDAKMRRGCFLCRSWIGKVTLYAWLEEGLLRAAKVPAKL